MDMEQQHSKGTFDLHDQQQLLLPFSLVGLTPENTRHELSIA
jgi:hypothetical protein